MCTKFIFELSVKILGTANRVTIVEDVYSKRESAEDGTRNGGTACTVS